MSNKKFKNKTVCLPDCLLIPIDSLIDIRLLTSRSEFIRRAIFAMIMHFKNSGLSYNDPFRSSDRFLNNINYTLSAPLLALVDEFVVKGFAKDRSSLVRIAIYHELKRWELFYNLEVIHNVRTTTTRQGTVQSASTLVEQAECYETPSNLNLCSPIDDENGFSDRLIE